MQLDIVDLSSREIASGSGATEQFSLDVLTGLSARPKYIPAKYFYDDRGSRIFQQISHLQEYYLTRAELGILAQLADFLPRRMAEDRIDIIELGPGDGSKSRIIIDGFLRHGCEVCFYPIDISAKALDLLAGNMTAHHGLAIHGVIADYFDGLRYARSRSSNRQLVLFLGSNIGNFDRRQCLAFLRRVWKALDPDDRLIIGFDLKKDVAVLTRAYNDSRGLTRAFNLNILHRINRELGGDFRVEEFEHLGIYNPVLGAMESYLLARRPQDVYIAELERSFRFEAYEPLHLEYSFKFLDREIVALAACAGFEVEGNFPDTDRYFVDSVWLKKQPHSAAST
jgi:L-histidine N-alpha-methyltransferase